MALTLEKIIRESVKIANKDGLHGLSMRKLAKRLNVEAMSLYNHVQHKDQLLDELVDFAFMKVEWQPDASDWRRSLHQRCVSLRQVLVKYPWAVGLLESRKTPGLQTLLHHDQVLGLMLESRFSFELAARTYAILDSYVYGFVLQEHTLAMSSSDEISAQAEAIFAKAKPGQLKNMITMTQNYYFKPGYSFSNEFEKGLGLILNSVQAEKLAQSPSEEK